jgi:hypothetical protein
MSNTSIIIDWLEGCCPVQAEGTVNGIPFYFRARGSQWSIEIGDEWVYTEKYGEWPTAGWMDFDEAKNLIHSSCEKFVKELQE